MVELRTAATVSPSTLSSTFTDAYTDVSVTTSVTFPDPAIIMNDWLLLSFICILLGFLLVVLALSGARHDLSGADGAVEALEICGFVAFLLTVVVSSVLRYAELDYEKEISYGVVAISFLAVVFILVGLVLYGCRVSRKPPPYTTTLLVSGALLSALAGTFILLQVFEV